MKILRLLVVVAFASAAPARAQQGGAILLSAVSGSVELQQGPDQPWKAAAAGAEMREGYSLRTGPDGRAQVTFPDKAVVWVKESSNFGMQSTLPLTRKIQVTQGEVKASVPHLKRKQTFEVHTTNAVAAVRGTVFTVQTDANGAMEVKVAFGEVKLHLLAEAKTYSVPQGNFFHKEEGLETKVSLMTKDQEKSILVDWSPGLANSDRDASLNKKEESRNSVRDFARQTDLQQAAIAALVQQTKDGDFSAGRTLVDVHGNLTRVDQRMLRPAADSLQFMNLVKRPDYTYVDHVPGKPWTNTQGHVANRLDSMQAFVTFDKDLPQELVEWPSFVKNNDITMKRADMVMTNQTGHVANTADILVLGSFGVNCKYFPNDASCTREVAKGNITTGEDQIAGDFFIGSVTDISEVRDKTKLLRVTNLSGAGVADFKQDGEASSTLYAYHAGALQTAAGDQFWLTSEAYVINNEGKISNVDDFAKSGKDPFSLLKETAFEGIIALKATTGGIATNSAAGTNPNIGGDLVLNRTNEYGNPVTINANKNIDLVVIPDLAVAIVQKLGSALSDANSGNQN
jgi:hypothetical protein